MMYNSRFEDYMKQKNHMMNDKKARIISLLVVLILFIINFFSNFFALNIRDLSFDFLMIFLIILYGGLFTLMTGKTKTLFNCLKIVGIIIGLLVIGFISSMPLFRAADYQQQLDMTEVSEFSSAFKKIDLNNIPLVDKEVAKIMGDKKIGEIQGLGSQFDIASNYTIISQNDKIYRVSPLVYQDLVKWFQNRKKGIPGYVKIDVNDPNNAEIIQLDDGIRLSPGGFLWDNLYLNIRLKYPTLMLGECNFEIDDDGNPYFVLPYYSYDIGLFGGADSKGVVVVNPVNREMKKYSLEEVPSWVDHVQMVNAALNQMNNWGYYVHGFFNTLFGQKDMLQMTGGYNYVTIDSQIYLYSGMTSIGSDHSIVGFGLINLKNQDASFFRIGGADEESAMSSAQGQVQHLGYYATYPILLNVENIPSYYISLKDQEGLVKMYSFTSVSNYSIVGVGESLKDAKEAYLALLKKQGIISSDISLNKQNRITGTIKDITSAIIDGNTHYFIVLDDIDEMFIIDINLSKELPFSKIGDLVEIEYIDDADNDIEISVFDNKELQY